MKRNGVIISNDKINMLFLCTGNSCRSQMAEGWTRALKPDFIEPYSAGIESHGLNPYTVRVMSEAGVDISNHRSTPVGEPFDIPFDYVVTVCDHANEHCPVFPRPAKRVHVGFDDPNDRGGRPGSLQKSSRRNSGVCRTTD